MSRSGTTVITLLVVIAILIAGYFAIRHQSSGDVYREYMSSHEPWQSYEGTKDAIYLMDGHTMVVFDSASNRYWSADLEQFYVVLFKAIGCNEMGECTEMTDFKINYPIFGAVFSVAENYIQVTFEEASSSASTQPVFFYVRSSLDGKDIRVTE